eukprot:gene831-594_t
MAVSLEGLKNLMSKKLVLPPDDDAEDLDDLSAEPQIKGFQRVSSDAEVSSRYISIGSVSLKSYMSRDSEFTSYMTRWEEAICRLMTGELRRIVNRINDWKKDGCGMGINGEALTEIFHHCRWAANKVNLFRGRSDLVDAGISGSGKTTLMAKLAAEAYALEKAAGVETHQQRRRPVVIRFCGTSPGSNDGLSLITSITTQILFLYEGEARRTPPPATFAEALAQFHAALATYPVILFIDSLDQLGNAYLERSRISILQDVQPHPDSVIVVSTLPDEKDPLTGLWKYCYQCETRLKESRTPVLKVSAMEEESKTMELLQTMLLVQYKRTCSPRQWTYIRQQTMVEPTALYLQLACRVISSWASYDQGCELAEGVQPLITQIFTALERDYGVALTRAALGFVTFSVQGVNDNEIQDLLSLHDAVIDDVFQYSSLSIRRLPFHVWARLRSALEGLIVEKQSGCLKWYHRQLQEAAERRYQFEKQTLHKLMGLYFGNCLAPDLQHSRLIATQPLLHSDIPVWLPSTRINRRRCAEAGFHLVQAQQYEEAARLLCNMDEICACVKSGFAIEMLHNLVDIEAALPTLGWDEDMAQQVSHYVRWLRTYLNMINEHPTMNIPLTALLQPPLSFAHRDMVTTLAGMRSTCSMAAMTLDIDVDVARLTHAWIVAHRFGGPSRFGRKLSSISTYAENVSRVCFSPDGQQLATALADRRVSIWDRMTGLETVAFMGHTKGVLAICYNRDGRYLASAGADGTVRLWEVSTGTEVACYEGHRDAVTAVVFSSDDRHIISASYDSDICVWNGVTTLSMEHDGGLHRSFQTPLIRTITSAHDGAMICGLALSPNNQFLASRGLDYQMKIWKNDESFALVATLYGLGFMASNVAFSPDGQLVASGGDENTIMVWETSTWTLVHTIQGHTDQVYSVTFSPDGRFLAAGDQARVVKVWHMTTTTATEVLHLDGHNLAVYSVSFSPDGKLLASGSSDSTIGIWDVRLPQRSDSDTPEEADTTADLLPEEEPKGHFKIVDSLAIRPVTGDRLVSGSYDKTVKLWDTTTGDEVATIREHSRWVYCVCFTPDGQQIVSGSDDGKACIADAQTGTVVRTLALSETVDSSQGVMSVAVSPCGSFIVTGANDSRVRLWESATGALLWEEDTFDAAVAQAAAEVAAAKQSLTAEKRRELTSRQRVSAVTFTADGRFLAAGSFDNSIHVWRCDTREKVNCWRNEHVREIMTLYSSRCGGFLVSASRDTTVGVWSMRAGRRLHRLAGHTRFATCAIFTPDASRVVSISVDKTIKIWCVATGHLLHSLILHHQSGYSLAISDDGRHLFAGYGDGTIVSLEFWALNNDEGPPPVAMHTKDVAELDR